MTSTIKERIKRTIRLKAYSMRAPVQVTHTRQLKLIRASFKQVAPNIVDTQ